MVRLKGKCYNCQMRKRSAISIPYGSIKRLQAIPQKM